MRHIVLFVAGLSFRDVKTHWNSTLCGLRFHAAASTFPALTCTAQAAFRTATELSEHGMPANGIFSRKLGKAMFWEQSAALVGGTRIFERARQSGAKIAMLFWQQSLGEKVDIVFSPAPIHKHGGSMMMSSYTLPRELGEMMQKKFGSFPLHRYWGPLAGRSVGDSVVGYIEEIVRICAPDVTLAYLPTLDYDLQRFGPGDIRVKASFDALERQIAKIVRLAEETGAELTVVGDYAINDVTAEPVFPNRILRENGFLNVRHVNGMAYHDIFSSRAFAMADHEIAHVYVKDADDIEKVADLFCATGGYSEIIRTAENKRLGHDASGELLLVAERGSWCAYPWWTERREAPDFASHVDIHSKPGFDPCELFFGRFFPPGISQDASRVKGTHGRRDMIAYASTRISGETFTAIAESCGRSFILG